MSLSRTLQSPEILSKIIGKSFDEMKDILMEISNRYYEENPKETTDIIKKNLESFGLPSDLNTVKKVQEHLVYHYIEKIFPLAGKPVDLANFIKERMECTQAKEMLTNAIKEGSVLIAVSHFGAVECMVTCLAYHKFIVNPVLKFTTQNFSKKLQDYAKLTEEAGFLAPIKFIEIGKPGAPNAMQMARVLDKKEILFTVFDEETPHSTPVKLFNRKVLGGSGLDRLLKFAHQKVTVFNAFMIRDGKNYRMELLPVNTNTDNLIQEMFNNMQSILEKHYEQWYFLHEEIPFAD